MNAEDRLLQWLRDAHAMEEQAEQMLSGMSGRIRGYPELAARIEQHLSETRRQTTLVRGCIERLGGSPSALKGLTARAVGFAQAASGLFAGDEIVKGVLASYTFEQMEIASYRILIVAAEIAGDAQTRDVCAEILQEEEAMAGWLAEQLPIITRTYLAREETPGVSARR